MKNAFYIILIICNLGGCYAQKNISENKITLPAVNFNVIGRYAVKDDQKIELITSGAHFGFSFKGKECHVLASLSYSGQHNYLQYELDGVYQKRIRLEGAVDQPILITAPDDGKHTVWIYKATEAHTGAIVIKEIVAKDLRPLEVSKKPIIEFIGNSITCGAAADASSIPCGQGAYHDQHNAYAAYGPRLARNLGTEFILSSVSGIGIYRNWNTEGPAMPAVFEKNDFQPNSPAWDFNVFKPNIVSIALGTNDFSDGDGKNPRLPFDSARFVSQYIEFVKQIKSKYPSSRFILLSSPMIHGEKRTKLQNCLTVVKHQSNKFFPSDKPIEMYFFKPMQAKGCTGHPSVEDHTILADELATVFSKLLSKSL